IRNIIHMERRITNERLRSDTIKDAKILGFSDARIGHLVGKPADNIREFRKAHHIVPFTKQIDTLAAEWPTNTNYVYLTYGGSDDDLVHSAQAPIMVLSSVCYRSSTSVAFDGISADM